MGEESVIGKGFTQNIRTTVANAVFFAQGVRQNIRTWTASNVPAFKQEPDILSTAEHLTRVTFEIARVEFPNISYNDLSPTYQRLNEKLLDLDDFGTPLNTNFKSLTNEITSGTTDELSKLAKIHDYISGKILWNGNRRVRASSTLKTVMRKEKGNSADINMILIAMLRSAGMKADPVILSTRSNGSLDQNSGMLKQFNYLVAAVVADDKLYIVDATDPLRPFDLLPFDCLNGTGRLIHLSESRFVELKNNKTDTDSFDYDVLIDDKGHLTGTFKATLSGYSAYAVREMVRLEGEDGYLDLLRRLSPYAEISGLKFKNLGDPGADLTLTSDLKVNDGAQFTGDKLIFNSILSMESIKNPYYSEERKYPVNLGSPVQRSYSFRIRIPEGYSVSEKPSDASFTLPDEGGQYEFSCTANGNEITFNQKISIKHTLFQTPEYPSLRSFYEKILRKEAEMVVLKKNPVIR